jgi:hypothetical protein
MAGVEKLAQLAGVALFAVAGAAAVQLLPALQELPLGRRLAHAYLLGVAWIAGSLYGLSHFLSVPLRRPAILAVASLPLLAWLAVFLSGRLGSPASRKAPDRRCRGLRTVAFVLASVAFLAILPDVLVNPLRDWDGRMTWCAQARYMRAEGTVSPTVLTQPGWFVTHPWYPVLMPVAQVAVLEVLQAGEDDHFFRGLYAFFFPVWLLILYGGARRWTRPGAAAWTTMAASLFSVVSIFRGGGATSAYSDLPLACFYGAGLLLLLKPRLRLSEGLAAGLLLGAAVLTKSEGAPLALWALVVAAAVPLASWTRLTSRWRPIALAGGGVAAALVLLLSWRAGIPARYESYGSLISWSYLWPGVISRAPLLLSAIRKQMIALADWGIFWSAAPLVLLAGWRGLRRRVTPALLLTAVAPLGIAWIAYSVSLDPLRLVETTWNRFILQASVPLLILFSLALDDLLQRSPWVPAALGGPARSRSRHPDTPVRSRSSASPSSSAPDPPTA